MSIQSLQSFKFSKDDISEFHAIHLWFKPNYFKCSNLLQLCFRMLYFRNVNVSVIKTKELRHLWSLQLFYMISCNIVLCCIKSLLISKLAVSNPLYQIIPFSRYFCIKIFAFKQCYFQSFLDKLFPYFNACSFQLFHNQTLFISFSNQYQLVQTFSFKIFPFPNLAISNPFLIKIFPFPNLAISISFQYL